MTFFYKIGNQEGKKGPLSKIVTSRKGNTLRRMYRRVNVMEILYTHACKWKNGTGETVSEMWGC
jgi:hypothetical protein